MTMRLWRLALAASKPHSCTAAFFQNLEEAQTEIFEFIEMYYNTLRRRSSLNYQSPMAYENNYFTPPSNFTVRQNRHPSALCATIVGFEP